MTSTKFMTRAVDGRKLDFMNKVGNKGKELAKLC